MNDSYAHIDCRAEQGILVMTIRDQEIQGDEIANALRIEMLGAAEQFQAQSVIVDFRNTAYISSVAFWPLLSLYRKLQANGGRVTICGLSPTVGDVFYSTRLVSPTGSFTAPFGVETDVEAALSRVVKKEGAAGE